MEEALRVPIEKVISKSNRQTFTPVKVYRKKQPVKNLFQRKPKRKTSGKLSTVGSTNNVILDIAQQCERSPVSFPCWQDLVYLNEGLALHPVVLDYLKTKDATHVKKFMHMYEEAWLLWICSECLVPDTITEDYVGCDGCNAWFHHKCVNFDAQTFPKKKKWYCDKCKKN